MSDTDDQGRCSSVRADFRGDREGGDKSFRSSPGRQSAPSPGFDSNSRTVPPGAPGGQAQRDFPSSSLTTRCMAIKAHGDARSLGGGLTLCCELLFDEGLDPLLIARLDVQKLDADSLSFDAVSDNCLTGNIA